MNVVFFRVFNEKTNAILRGLLFVTALCAILFINANSFAQNKNAPALWKIETRQSTTYLFGSFHLLKAETEWKDERIMSAFAESQDLTLEIDQSQMSQSLMAFLIQNNGLYGQHENLEDKLSSESWQKFRTLSEQMGFPLQSVQKMKPWYAATVLSVQYAQTQGFDQNLGVDNVLTRMATEQKMPLIGLELAADQIKAFANLKNKTQIDMLEDTIESLIEMPVVYKELLTAWLGGDEEELEKALIEDMKDVPDLYKSLMIKRNRAWVPKLKALMGQPGTHFVVVGAGHLVGEDSVLNMLKTRGYVSERVY